MQRSRSRKLAKLARQTTVRPTEPRFAKLVRHASIGAAVVASISAARAQQADFTAASIAQAQQSDATTTASTPAPATTTSADQGGLQEVIVTATKRSENIQSIPITITAVTGANLEA